MRGSGEFDGIKAELFFEGGRALKTYRESQLPPNTYHGTPATAHCFAECEDGKAFFIRISRFDEDGPAIPFDVRVHLKINDNSIVSMIYEKRTVLWGTEIRAMDTRDASGVWKNCPLVFRPQPATDDPKLASKDSADLKDLGKITLELTSGDFEDLPDGPVPFREMRQKLVPEEMDLFKVSSTVAPDFEIGKVISGTCKLATLKFRPWSKRQIFEWKYANDIKLIRMNVKEDPDRFVKPKSSNESTGNTGKRGRAPDALEDVKPNIAPDSVLSAQDWLKFRREQKKQQKRRSDLTPSEWLEWTKVQRDEQVEMSLIEFREWKAHRKEYEVSSSSTPEVEEQEAKEQRPLNKKARKGEEGNPVDLTLSDDEEDV